MVVSWTPLFVSFNVGWSTCSGKPATEIARLQFLQVANGEKPCRARHPVRTDIPEAFSRHLARVAPTIEEQHQRRELADEAMRRNGRRLCERQGQIAFANAANRLRQFMAKRNRDCHRPTGAA